MKKFNTRLFLFLVAGAIVLGAGLFVIHYFQSGRIASALLWQADRAEKKGDVGGAVRYLRRYLEFAPEDMEERIRLGRTLASPKLAGSPRAREQALFVLEQVVTREPDRHDLRRILARIATELRQFDLARTHLDVLEKHYPQDAEVQFLWGQWHEAKAPGEGRDKDLRARYEAAAKCYAAAVKLAPRQPKYAVRLADVLFVRLDRSKEAQEVVDAARKYAPDDSGLLLAAAGLAHDQGDRDTALKVLQRGRDLYTKDANFCKAEAGIWIKENQRDKAISCLKQGLKTLPGDTHADLVWTISNLLLDINKPKELKEARENIAKLQRARLMAGAMDYLEARLLMCEGDWAKAARVLKRIQPKMEAAPELLTQIHLYLGQCYEQLDEPAKRLAAYQRAADGDQKSVAARIGRGDALWAMGRREDALSEYRQIMDLPHPPLDALTEYARKLIAANRVAEKPRWQEVDRVLDRAEKVQKDAVEVALLRAEALSARNKFPRAAQILEEARKAHPREVKLRVAQAVLAEARGKPETALGVLQTAQDELGDRVELRLAKAGVLVSQHGAAAAKDLARLADNLGRFEEQGQSDLLCGLAEAHYRIDEVKTATRLLDRAVRLPRHRNDMHLRLRLFDLYLEAEDAAGLDRVLEEMRRIEGSQGIWWRYGRATALIWRARRDRPQKEKYLEEAARLLDAVAEQRPRWSAVPLARAEIETLRGNEHKALGYTEQALLLGETNKRFIRQLVERSQALATKGEKSLEAEVQLSQAITLAGDVPELYVSYVRYMAATGQVAKAREIITKRAGVLERTEDGRLALGQCYEAAGQPEEALKQYQAVQKGKPNEVAGVRAMAGFYMRNGLPQQAKPFLERIVQGKIKATDNDIAWAKQALAMVLATGTDFKEFRAALKLVGMRLDEATGKAVTTTDPAPAERYEIQRSRARVLATQSIRIYRQHAITLLEDLRRQRKLQPEDHYLLAVLYEADGESTWPKARELFRSLVANHKNPLYLGHFAQSLLVRRDKEADSYIARLARLEKDLDGKEGGYGSIELRARALELDDQPDKAVALLKAYAAEKSDRPDRHLALAGLLGRLGRLSEALDACEKARAAGAPAEVVGGANVGLLRLAKAPDPECPRVETFLQQELKRNNLQKKEKTTLLVQLADLRDLRGRFDEAEALYRQVLDEEKDSENVMALNNLAWLLAHRHKNRQLALEKINQAIEVAGPRAELLDTRAVVYLSLGQSARAITDLESALEDTPSPARYFHLARAHHMARQAAAARKALDKAKLSGPELKRLLHPAERVEFDRIHKDLYKR
jgi:tetratricopeptide (TPR) repeat protein